MDRSAHIPGTIRLRLLVVMLILLLGSSKSSAEELIVAYNYDWAPFSYLNAEGEVEGILPRLTEILFEQAGTSIEIVNVGLPWNRVQQAVLRNQTDAFITFASEERLQFTQPIGPVFYALEQKPVTRLDDSVSVAQLIDGLDARYCRMQGDNWSQEFYRARSLRAFAAKDSRACLNLIATNRGDLFLHPSPIVEIRLRQMGLEQTLRQSDRTLGDMPFHLLLSRSSIERFGPSINLISDALTRLQREGQWHKMIERTESAEIQRCFEENKDRC